MLFRSQKAASLIQVMLAAGMVAGIALVVGSFVTDSSRVSMRISAGDQCQLTLASIMNNLKSNDNSLLDANRMSYLPVAGALDPEAVLNPSGAAEDWYRFSMGANAGLDTQQTYPIVRTCSGVNLNDNLICPVRRFAQDGSTSITTPLATVNQQLLSLARYTNTWQLLRTPAVRASMIYNTNAAYCAGGVQINAGAAGINSLWAAALNNVGLGNLTNPVVTMQIQRMRADGSVNCNGAGSGTAGIIPITGNANRTSAQNAFLAADTPQVVISNDAAVKITGRLSFNSSAGVQSCENTASLSMAADKARPTITPITLTATATQDRNSLPMYCGSIPALGAPVVPTITANFSSNETAVFYACRLQYEGLNANLAANNFGTPPYEYQDSGWFVCTTPSGQVTFQAGVDPNTIDPNNLAATTAPGRPRATISIVGSGAATGNNITLTMNGFAEGVYNLSVIAIDSSRNISAINPDDIVGTPRTVRFSVDLLRPISPNIPDITTQDIVGGFNVASRGNVNGFTYLDPALYPYITAMTNRFAYYDLMPGESQRLFQCTSTAAAGQNAEWQLNGVTETYPIANFGSKWWFGPSSVNMVPINTILNDPANPCEIAIANLVRKRPTMLELNVLQTGEYMAVARACDECGQNPNGLNSLRRWLADLSAAPVAHMRTGSGRVNYDDDSDLLNRPSPMFQLANTTASTKPNASVGIIAGNELPSLYSCETKAATGSPNTFSALDAEGSLGGPAEQNCGQNATGFPNACSMAASGVSSLYCSTAVDVCGRYNHHATNPYFVRGIGNAGTLSAGDDCRSVGCAPGNVCVKTGASGLSAGICLRIADIQWSGIGKISPPLQTNAACAGSLNCSCYNNNNHCINNAIAPSCSGGSMSCTGSNASTCQGSVTRSSSSPQCPYGSTSCTYDDDGDACGFDDNVMCGCSGTTYTSLATCEAVSAFTTCSLVQTAVDATCNGTAVCDGSTNSYSDASACGSSANGTACSFSESCTTGSPAVCSYNTTGTSTAGRMFWEAGGSCGSAPACSAATVGSFCRSPTGTCGATDTNCNFNDRTCQCVGGTTTTTITVNGTCSGKLPNLYQENCVNQSFPFTGGNLNVSVGSCQSPTSTPSGTGVTPVCPQLGGFVSGSATVGSCGTVIPPPVCPGGYVGFASLLSCSSMYSDCFSPTAGLFCGSLNYTCPVGQVTYNNGPECDANHTAACTNPGSTVWCGVPDATCPVGEQSYPDAVTCDSNHTAPCTNPQAGLWCGIPDGCAADRTEYPSLAACEAVHNDCVVKGGTVTTVGAVCNASFTCPDGTPKTDSNAVACSGRSNGDACNFNSSCTTSVASWVRCTGCGPGGKPSCPFGVAPGVSCNLATDLWCHVNPPLPNDDFLCFGTSSTSPMSVNGVCGGGSVNTAYCGKTTAPPAGCNAPEVEFPDMAACMANATGCNTIAGPTSYSWNRYDSDNIQLNCPANFHFDKRMCQDETTSDRIEPDLGPIRPLFNCDSPGKLATCFYCATGHYDFMKFEYRCQTSSSTKVCGTPAACSNSTTYTSQAACEAVSGVGSCASELQDCTVGNPCSTPGTCVWNCGSGSECSPGPYAGCAFGNDPAASDAYGENCSQVDDYFPFRVTIGFCDQGNLICGVSATCTPTTVWRRNCSATPSCPASTTEYPDLVSCQAAMSVCNPKPGGTGQYCGAGAASLCGVPGVGGCLPTDVDDFVDPLLNPTIPAEVTMSFMRDGTFEKIGHQFSFTTAWISPASPSVGDNYQLSYSIHALGSGAAYGHAAGTWHNLSSNVSMRFEYPFNSSVLNMYILVNIRRISDGAVFGPFRINISLDKS